MISADSFKIRISSDKTQIYDSRISSTKSIVIDDTGEVEREFKERSHKIEKDGIKLRFGLEKQQTADQSQKEYLTILINSKLLEDRYFEGITSENIRLVYDRLISHKVVDFSYEVFLQGELTDVDFKKDVVHKGYTKSFKNLVSHAKVYKEIEKGCKAYRGRLNMGVQYGVRDKAKENYPFLKFYHKGKELKYNSGVFYERFLRDNDVDLDNLIRVETTIKNKRHFRRFGIENTTLENILSLDQNTKEKFLQDAYKIHLEDRQPQAIKMNKNISPTDQVTISNIKLMISSGKTIEQILIHLRGSMNCDPKSRRNHIQRVEDLHRLHVKDSPEDLISEEQERFFKSIGWSA